MKFIISLSLVLCLAFTAKSQTLSEIYWMPTNGVYGMDVDTANNLLYVGGDFTRWIPKEETCGANVNLLTGVPDFTFANPNMSSNVFCSVADGNGGYFIGGNFTQVGDSIRKCVAHLNANGDVTSWNPEIVGNSTVFVRSMVLIGDDLYLGGHFTQIGGEIRNNLAIVSAANGSLDPWYPEINGQINQMLVSNNGLYIGGLFTSFLGPTVYQNLMRFDMTTGIASNWNPDVNGMVRGLAIKDTTVYIANQSFTVNGETRNGIAAIDVVSDGMGTIIGDSLNAFEIDITGSVYCMHFVGDTMFVGGQFTSINSETVLNVASLNPQTGDNIPMNLLIDGDVYALTHRDSLLYFGGNFMYVDNGLIRQSVGAYNIYLSQLAVWNPVVEGGDVSTITLSDTTAYIGGTFGTIGSKYRNKGASINSLTGEPTSWNPNFNGRVNVVHIKDDMVIYGGDFTTVSGTPRNHIAAFDINTGNLLNWNFDINGSVNTILSLDSLLFVGGGFTQIDGVDISHLGAINLNTETVENWNPLLNDSVKEVYVAGNYLYAGGNFTQAGSEDRTNIARFDLNSGLSLDIWSPLFNGNIEAITQSGNQILVGGSFTQVNNEARNFMASVQASTGAVNTLDLNPDYPVLSLKSIENRVYIGGEFHMIGGQNRMYTAELDMVNEVVTPWNISPTESSYGSTYVFSIIDDQMYLAGGGDGGGSGNVLGVEDFTEIAPEDFSVSTFTYPTGLNGCSGKIIIQPTGAPDFTAIIDGTNGPYSSNGFMTVDSLCAGIHTLKVYDYYNDSIEMTFVIGQDSSTFIVDTNNLNFYNDLVGGISENCDIVFLNIDSIFVYEAEINGTELLVVWSIVQDTVTSLDSVYYQLINGDGFYYIQYSLFCPFKTINDYYVHTEEIAIFDGNVSTAGIGEQKESEILIYPNPTTNLVAVSFEGSNAELTVYDTQGTIIQDHLSIQPVALVSLKDLQNGVYFFEITTDEGKTVKRVVKN